MITMESLATEFPAWEAWQGIDRLWHARIRGAVPPVMVHGDDLVDLRDQIRAYIGRQEESWKGWASRWPATCRNPGQLVIVVGLAARRHGQLVQREKPARFVVNRQAATVGALYRPTASVKAARDCRSGAQLRRGVSSMVEQRTFNPWVQGSSPWRPTSEFSS
jgi:hypothetical protein